MTMSFSEPLNPVDLNRAGNYHNKADVDWKGTVNNWVLPGLAIGGGAGALIYALRDIKEKSRSQRRREAKKNNPRNIVVKQAQHPIQPTLNYFAGGAAAVGGLAFARAMAKKLRTRAIDEDFKNVERELDQVINENLKPKGIQLKVAAEKMFPKTADFLEQYAEAVLNGETKTASNWFQSSVLYPALGAGALLSALVGYKHYQSMDKKNPHNKTIKNIEERTVRHALKGRNTPKLVLAPREEEETTDQP